MITIISKNQENIKYKKNESIDFKWSLEEGIEEYIKWSLGVNE